MRLLSKKEVKALVIYSYAHIARLEAEGKFPQRVRLGEGRYCRVGWVEREIYEWIEARISARNKARKTSR
jgi:predicted DNA-binding transcriptional regulator AlpA